MSEQSKPVPPTPESYGLSTEACLALIRGNLEVWSLMYFDEVAETETHCFSYLEEADSDYYNATHLVRQWNPEIQEDIECYFAEKEVPPAVFIDPGSASWLPEKLLAEGYRPLPEITECYEIFRLNPASVSRIQQASVLRLESSRCEIQVVSPHELSHAKAFEDFLRIDQSTNEISDPVLRKLRQNLVEKTHPEVTMRLLLGTVDGVAAFTGSVGIYRGMAFLAEGGTLPEYRRLGLHAAMLRERLLLAAEHQATIACFTCFEGAASGVNAEKLGFVSPFRRYLYKKS